LSNTTENSPQKYLSSQKRGAPRNLRLTFIFLFLAI
jgi:hypothetical protein